MPAAPVLPDPTPDAPPANGWAAGGRATGPGWALSFSRSLGRSLGRLAGRLPWPAPALLTWLACWLLLAGLRRAAPVLGGPPGLAWGVALALGLAVALCWPVASGWRRVFIAAGFPVSALASGLLKAGAVPLANPLPAWAWLLPLALLLAAYPLRAWRDAPLFPTPAGALAGLAALAPLAAGARVLDAGCGLGHGLIALRGQYPAARLEGVEWSWPLRAATALRCPWARVRRADMWAASWSGCTMVYVFQRPESMARALAKARAEMAPGSWLASLAFEVPGITADAALQTPGEHPVWLYRVGGSAAVSQCVAGPADNPVNEPAHPGGR